MDEHALRAQMASIAGRMVERGYISSMAGNLSARLPTGNLLLTPSGQSKADLKPEQILVVTMQGESLVAMPGFIPSSELPMHLEVYRQREDVGAVIHAHPVAPVALTLVGISMLEPLIPEAVILLGPVPTAEYATPSGEENRDAIRGLISGHDAILLSHHGSLTVGEDLQQAYDRLEALDHSARIIAQAHQLGTPIPLDEEAVEKLILARRRLGYNLSNSLESGPVHDPRPQDIEAIVQAVVEELLKS